MVIAIAFSFNAGRSRTTWQGFSLRWFLFDEGSVLRDATLRGALLQTLKLAVLTTLIATSLGAALAVGLTRWRGRIAKVANVTSLMTLVTPEIVIAVGLLIALGQLYELPLGTLTQVLGLATFTTALVMVIVRGRLLLIGVEYEQSAMDLGASPWQAFTRVLLRMLAPALAVGASVAFAVTMHDFVIAQYHERRSDHRRSRCASTLRHARRRALRSTLSRAPSWRPRGWSSGSYWSPCARSGAGAIHRCPALR